jgi:hypothetical protein
MGAPILVGWSVGDLTAGLIATVDAFTAPMTAAYHTAIAQCCWLSSRYRSVPPSGWVCGQPRSQSGVLTVAAIASTATYLLRRINTYLVRWARRKFNRLRSFKQAKRWWNGLLQRQPDCSPTGPG